MPVDRSTPDAVLHALARQPLLFDGAMGSTLNDFPDRDWEAPEEVTLRFPDRMARVYQAYLDAAEMPIIAVIMRNLMVFFLLYGSLVPGQII